jgi:MFS family permease
MTDHALDRSYRALLDVPSLPRVLLGMQLSRIAQSMVGVTVVLFALQAYDSPSLAGIVTFVWIFPGLLISPIAGALLDRHGRARLVVLDYLVALVALFAIAVLSLAGMLPAGLLVLIAFISSFTGPLSNTGLRSLLPMMVPSHLWERVNAIDSNGYVVATIVGPPIAAAMVQVVGGPATLIAIGCLYGVSATVLFRIKDPPVETASSGRLLHDAWLGLLYTWRNRTLRGLGFSISALNISGGMTTIMIPLIVLQRLDEGEAMVGVMFALLGVGGMATALIFGRMDTRGREKRLLVLPMLLMAPATALLLPDAGLLPVALGVDGPGLRRLDGVQLRRLPDRRVAHRVARDCVRRRGDHHGGGGVRGRGRARVGDGPGAGRRGRVAACRDDRRRGGRGRGGHGRGEARHRGVRGRGSRRRRDVGRLRRGEHAERGTPRRGRWRGRPRGARRPRDGASRRLTRSSPIEAFAPRARFRSDG